MIRRSTAYRPRLSRPASTLLAALVLAGAARAQSELVLRYQLLELTGGETGSTRAYAINNTGQVVGYIEVGDKKHSAHWHNRVTTDLHGTVHYDLQHPYPLFNQDYSEAFDISDADQVIGTARISIDCPPNILITNAFIVRPAVLTDLATPYPGDALTNLRTFGNPCDTAYDSAATGVSNSNIVVGWADRSDGVTHAFLVRPIGGQFFTDQNVDLVNDLMIDLGTLRASDPVSSATAVNDNGEVTGYSYTTVSGRAAYRAFLLTPLDNNNDGVPDQWFVDAGDGANALMIDLGTLGGSNSWGRAISNSGVIVGESDLDMPTGEHYTRAFRWANGIMTDLGTLREDPNHGFSSASGINDDGVIVGWAENEARERRAFIWQRGRMQDLNELLYLKTESGSTITPSITLTEARDINDDGVIVGWGNVKGTQGATTRGFLLIPTLVDPAELEEDENNGTGGTGGTGGNYNGIPVFGPPTTPGDSEPNEPNTPTTPGSSWVGLCGSGTLTMLPLTIVGWCGLRFSPRHRIHRR